MYFDYAQYKQKGQTLIFLLIGILAIAVAGGAFYLGRQTTPKPPTPVVSTQTPQPTQIPTGTATSPVPTDAGETANWKTYTDKVNGFSFKYPDNWVNSPARTGMLFQEPGVGPEKSGIGVDIYEDAGNLSAAQFLDQIFYKDFTGNQKILKDTYIKNNTFKPVSVDGISATLLDLLTPPGSRGTAVWLTKGRAGILLKSNPVEGGKEILNKILSTVKFTQ